MKKKNPLDKILKGTKQTLSDFQQRLSTYKQQRENKFKYDLPKSQLHGMQHIVWEISAGTVAKMTSVVLLLLLLCFFLYQINGILILLFVSFLFAAALDPLVDFFQKRKIPRSIGVLLIYIIVFYVIGVSISSLAPVMAKQFEAIGKSMVAFVQNITSSGDQATPLAKQLKPVLDQIYQVIDIKAVASQLQDGLTQLAGQLVTISVNFSLGLMNFILVLILTFFMTVEESGLHDFFLSLFPSRYGDYVSTRMEAVKEKIGHWLRGQLLLSIVGGIITYIGLLIFNVDYALTLSVIAGILMVIPVFGRIFALIITLPLIMNQSIGLTVGVTIFYLVLQQIENSIIVPYIMNKAVGLSPIITIFAMLVGAQYLGILGLVIALPIATSVAIFVKDYMEKAK